MITITNLSTDGRTQRSLWLLQGGIDRSGSVAVYNACLCLPCLEEEVTCSGWTLTGDRCFFFFGCNANHRRKIIRINVGLEPEDIYYSRCLAFFTCMDRGELGLALYYSYSTLRAPQSVAIVRRGGWPTCQAHCSATYIGVVANIK